MTVADAREHVTTIRRPAPADAQEVARAGLEAGALVTLFGTCTVDYDGRASSRLAAGDRHVMLKPDGTALVHTAEGHQPVNWQPPGCDHAVTVEDGRVVIRSDRRSPEEHLVVRFDRLRQVSAFDVRESADLALSGTHEDLRARVLDDPERIEAGFKVLDTERRTSAGTIDVYGEDAEGNAVVVEIKRSRSGPEAVGQLRRYVDALERDLRDRGKDDEQESEDGDGDRDGVGDGHGDGTVRGILVAPSATDRARRLLEQNDMGFVPLSPAPGPSDE